MSSPVTSVDPLFHNTLGNDNVARHIFETLVSFNADFELVPRLAVSWRRSSDLVWEFKLRENVRFHDGSRFTAADVKFSIDRAQNMTGSPSSYAHYTRQIEKIVIVDDHTIQFHTKSFFPLLPDELTYIYIQAGASELGLSTEDLNRGGGVVGTGPYRFRSWVPGRRIDLDASTSYWGARPEWPAVTILQMPSAAARVVGILSGELDLIDSVPPPDIGRLERDADVDLFTSVSNRLMYLQLDHRPTAPFVKGLDGKPLPRNALRDRRVREAISLAIDRDLIVEKVLGGRGLVANQYHPPIMPGSLKDLPPAEFDPQRSIELLEAAGIAGELSLTLHTSNDRYLYADKVAIAIGQSLSRVGIRPTIRVQPHVIFRTRGSKGELSFQLGSWSAENTVTFLASNLLTVDSSAGLGYRNRGFYSSPALDDAYRRAMSARDAEMRLRLLQEAARIALEDFAVIPLYFEVDAWAVRAGLCYDANPLQKTMATHLHRVCR